MSRRIELTFTYDGIGKYSEKLEGRERITKVSQLRGVVEITEYDNNGVFIANVPVVNPIQDAEEIKKKYLKNNFGVNI